MTAVAMTAGAMLAACAPGEILDVTDPDIINPSDVTTPAGADALRVGALARFASATSGAESFFLVGGLFADEYNNSDTFISRQEVDQRLTNIDNVDILAAVQRSHRARLSAMQAIPVLQQYKQGGPTRDVAEMYFVQAYLENEMAEHLCNGLVFSDVGLDGTENYGSQITTVQAFERALENVNAGLAVISGTTAADNRIRYALQVTKGRILLNLNRPADAATAVAGVPASFTYLINHPVTVGENWTWNLNNSARRYSVSTNEGINGLDFATANDPRLPVCLSTTTGCSVGSQTARDDNTTTPLYLQKKWGRESSVAISSGIEALLIRAEAELAAGQPGTALATLNAARATVTGLAPLTDAGTDAARVDQLFRERAFWLFGTGHRTGDLRRLVRAPYNRPANTVFPTGAWHKGGTYSNEVNMAVPAAERNNPLFPQTGATCMDRNA